MKPPLSLVVWLAGGLALTWLAVQALDAYLRVPS